MITLHKFGASFGLPDASPFVMKLETYLRLTKTEFDYKHADVTKAPKKKLPCLEIDDELVADSQFAIEALKHKFGDSLNEGLSATDLAQHHLLRLTLENHTYFLMLLYRWLDEKNALIIRDVYFGKMGLPGKVIFKLVQGGIRSTLQKQGTLRHSNEENEGLIAKDIQVLETVLGDKPFFGGDTPTEIDATTFGFIANMLVPDMETPFRTHSRKSERLINYHNRMTEEAFPDYKDTMKVTL